MALKELEELLKQERARQDAEATARQAAADEVKRLQKIKEEEQKNREVSLQRAREQNKVELQELFSRTGVLDGLRELQSTDDVRRAKKSVIVIDFDENAVTLAWGNKFAVENGKIIHETGGFLNKVWERDYKFITVKKYFNSPGQDASLRELAIYGLDRSFGIYVLETDLHAIQISLAKAFLNPGVEKIRSTAKERDDAARADAARWRENEYNERMKSEGH